MQFYYSTNKNVQIIVSLLKAHGIKRVIASPGTTNLELVVSMQHDPFFEMYSCVDERSAAYMACGLATETQEPVVITCTEATASRDYLPGLTEAYHRKLPVLAITGLHAYSCIGNLEPQVIDRSISPADSMRKKVSLPVIKDEADWNESVLLVNDAILELKRTGGGPVHINMPWNGGDIKFSVTELPAVKKIDRYTMTKKLPEISANKVVVFIGSHAEWSAKQSEKLDLFCKKYNAIAICDYSSKYYGPFRAQTTLISIQKTEVELFKNIDLLIHIGEEFCDDMTKRRFNGVKEVWRVSEDGELRDTFGKLTKVFEMPESFFFSSYIAKKTENSDGSYMKEYMELMEQLEGQVPVLPFSSIYAAAELSGKLPEKSVIHFGMSDSIRAWNMFRLPNEVRTSCNAGCRGIDGCVSSLVGASLANPNKLYYGVFGDLTFFYDMNVLGNRCINNNVRILVVNNDGGNIFRHTGHPTQIWLGYENTNLFVAAGGHFGKQSPSLLKHFAEDLGFEYVSASNKEEFADAAKQFLNPRVTDRPMVFEMFTTSENDNQAFEMMSSILLDTKGKAKEKVKALLGDQGTDYLRKLMKKKQ